MSRVNLVKGLGPVLQIAEGWTVELPDDVHKVLDERTNPTWPTTWFVPRLTDKDAFKDVYSVMANWGGQPWGNFLWTHWCRFNYAGVYFAHPGEYAQCG